MLRRRHFINAIGATLACVPLAFCAAPKLADTGYPDSLVATFLKPQLEKAKADKAYRQATLAQIRRVGGSTFDEVCFESMLDENQDLLWKPLILNAARVRMKLPPLTMDEVKRRRAEAKQ